MKNEKNEMAVIEKNEVAVSGSNAIAVTTTKASTKASTKANSTKANETISEKLTNASLRELCEKMQMRVTNNANSERCIYAQSTTKSRFLQSNAKAPKYQWSLLLIDDDMNAFNEWYNKQNNDIKLMFNNVATILSASEKPRTKQIKAVDNKALILFIKNVILANDVNKLNK